MATKIFWTEDEKAAVVREAALAVSRGETSRRITALNMGQERALPGHRRRPNLNTVSLVPWFEDALRDKLRQMREEREASELEEATRPEPEPEPQAPVDPLKQALSNLYDVIRAEISRTLPSIVEDVLTRHLQGLPQAPSAPQAPRKIPVATKALSVLIVGLKGGQMEEIRKEFSERFDLRFLGTNDNKHQLRSMSESADVSIGFTSFLSHSCEAIMKSRSPRYLPCDGGMVRLKETLRNLHS